MTHNATHSIQIIWLGHKIVHPINFRIHVLQSEKDKQQKNLHVISILSKVNSLISTMTTVYKWFSTRDGVFGFVALREWIHWYPAFSTSDSNKQRHTQKLGTKKPPPLRGINHCLIHLSGRWARACNVYALFLITATICRAHFSIVSTRTFSIWTLPLAVTSIRLGKKQVNFWRLLSG